MFDYAHAFAKKDVYNVDRIINRYPLNEHTREPNIAFP